MNALFVAALLGALGVLTGAFGAHGLRERLAPDQLAAFETAVRYQLVHALALLGVGILARQGLAGLAPVAHLFTWGVVLFCGSIYALSLGGPRWLGPITPIGGTALIAGWVALALAVREHGTPGG